MMARMTDVLIVGGGPAGLATAIALRRNGLSAMVVEAHAPGVDKACGEGLMPETVASLRALGVAVSDADGHPFRGIRFVNPKHRVEARFPDGVGLGVRRPVLHQKLADRAAVVGATLCWESRVMLQDGESAQVNGAQVRFKWLIGADGHSSSVARWSGLDTVRKQSLRYGFRRHYQVTPWSDYVEVHWGEHGQMYCTPVAPGCVGVAYITRHRGIDRDKVLASFPELAARLAGAGEVSQERGAVSATRHLRRVADGNVALVGDASGSADSITGEGLAVTFRQAQSLADSIAAGGVATYAREHRAIGKLPHAMGALMLTMDRWPALERRAMRALAANPELFRDLLSVHVGRKSGMGVAVRRGPRFGWSLLAGA